MDIDREEEIGEDQGETWSFSKLQTIQLCGHKYKLKYKDKVPEKKTVSLIFGSKIHKCIERMHQEGIWGEGQLQRFWTDSWLPTARKLNWDDELISATVYKNRGLKMLEQYRDRHQNDVIIASEINFKIPANDELPVISGTIDKIQEVEPGVLAVVDFKTSKNPPDQLVLDSDFQLTAYWMAAKNLGYNISMLAIHHLLSGEVYWTPRSEDNVEFMARALRDAQLKVKHEMFARNIDFHCKWCPFKEVCLGRNVSTVQEEPEDIL